VFDYDAELRRYHRWLVEAMDVRSDDTVLDIGCGTGLTTRTAAGIATRGSALGLDIAPEMVAEARSLAAGVAAAGVATAGVANVRFEQADAQVHPFPPAHFSLAASRFGTMFFTDPVAAFTNVGRALRPGARFVQLVWQGGDRQEWVAAIRQALLGKEPPVMIDDAFSLGDPTVAEGLLTTAGFTDVRITDVREPIYYGADPDAAVDSVRALRMVSDQVDATETEQALGRLRSLMAAHHTADGVWFDSCAWLITAVR
jgi:SAM-dependent methyltransferase